MVKVHESGTLPHAVRKAQNNILRQSHLMYLKKKILKYYIHFDLVCYFLPFYLEAIKIDKD